MNESARIVEESRENIGAAVMGRNMFGPAGRKHYWRHPNPDAG